MIFYRHLLPLLMVKHRAAASSMRTQVGHGSVCRSKELVYDQVGNELCLPLIAWGKRAAVV